MAKGYKCRVTVKTIFVTAIIVCEITLLTTILWQTQIFRENWFIKILKIVHNITIAIEQYIKIKLQEKLLKKSLITVRK